MHLASAPARCPMPLRAARAAPPCPERCSCCVPLPCPCCFLAPHAAPVLRPHPLFAAHTVRQLPILLPQHASNVVPAHTLRLLLIQLMLPLLCTLPGSCAAHVAHAVALPPPRPNLQRQCQGIVSTADG